MRVNIAPLRSLCQIKHGGTPSKANPSFWEGRIPWVSPKDMKSSSISSTADHISLEAVENSATSIVQKGTILVVARSGILAHTLPVATVSGPTAFNQDIKALIPDEERVEPEYLYWFVRSSAPLVLRQGVKKGATVHSLQAGFLEGLQVPLPPRNEQRRIVDLLSRTEGIVRLRREAQKKAAEIIPALFLDMFGDPATNPRGWETVFLGDLLSEPPTLGTMAKPSTTEAPWLDLRVANIQGGELQLNDKKWLDLPPEQIDRFSLRAGDVLLARAIGSLYHLGKTVIVEPTGNWTFDSHLMRLRMDQSKILPVFLKGFLESRSGREEFLKHTRRSAVQFNINGKEIRRLAIPLPPISLQIEFADRCRAVSAIMAQQASALLKAEATFNALLARVFSEGGQQAAARLEEAAVA